MRQLVLASTSPYRRELMARLGLPFEVADPVFDETLEQLWLFWVAPIAGAIIGAVLYRIIEGKK